MVIEHKKAPLLDTLMTFKQARYSSFHMPGHKGGAGIDSNLLTLTGSGMFEIDVTELPDTDDLHLPEGCISEAQLLAADAFGAAETFFLVNGTTCGIQAAIMACCKPGGKLVLPRNIHRSAVAGLIIAGAQPIWVLPDIDDDFIVPVTPNRDKFANIFNQESGIEATLLLQPTYHGFCGSLEEIIKIAHQHKLPVIVDEAHGPHFCFHKKLPPSAMSLGADIAVQSTHKMLTAMNQGSMLHIGKVSLVSAKQLFRQLTILQTTSPSFPILASLDASRRQMVLQGHFLLERALEMASILQKEVANIEGLKIAGTDDPCKLLISVKGLGISGFQAAEYLRRQHGIQVEMADFFNILLLLTFGNTMIDCDKLVTGLKGLSALRTKQNDKLFARVSRLFRLNPNPVCEMNPREAWYKGNGMISLESAKGKISAEMIAPYPPGIPILCPGEKITGDIVKYIKEIRELQLAVQGCCDPRLQFIKAVL